MPATILPVNGTFSPSGVVARRVRLRDRLAARLRPYELDAQLARGVPPDASVRLVLRAHRLISPSERLSLARGVRRVVRDAGVARRRLSSVPLQEAAVRDAAVALEDLARRLTAPEPVGVAGVAAARMLLVEPRSPLYAPRAPDTLDAVGARARGARGLPA